MFRATGEVGAFYRSALAQELANQGYAIEQATGKDGKYFEIAGVPEELRDAFSGRSREVARAADRFVLATVAHPNVASCATSRSRTAARSNSLTAQTLRTSGERPPARHDFGPDEALRLLAGERPRSVARPVEDRIESRLTERHAVFELRDLNTIALEQTAGELTPHEALYVRTR